MQEENGERKDATADALVDGVADVEVGNLRRVELVNVPAVAGVGDAHRKVNVARDFVHVQRALDVAPFTG